MPIAFRDAIDVEELGPAAFLRLMPGPSGREYFGALFAINARGEPLEFVYNRIELPDSFLWRQADLRRHAERKLAASLLGTATRQPRLLLGLAEEVGSELFCQDLRLDAPVGRVGRPLEASSYVAEESIEEVEQPAALHLFWFPAPPQADSLERQLFDHLRTHGLLLEPFERAATGLLEVYSAEAVDERRP